LFIHRDIVKSSAEAAYREMEQDTARLLRAAAPIVSEQQVGFPNAYLAAEALTGSREVWFLTAWNSMADFEQVGEDYRRRRADSLTSALERNAKRKAALTSKSVSVFAQYRPEMSRGERWTIGRGRFLVIRMTKASEPFEGTVYES